MEQSRKWHKLSHAVLTAVPEASERSWRIKESLVWLSLLQVSMRPPLEFHRRVFHVSLLVGTVHGITATALMAG